MSADSCCAARANFALLLFSGCFEFISRMKCARTRERLSCAWLEVERYFVIGERGRGMMVFGK